MKVALILALVCGALYLLHRLALWAEDRGWVYYQRHRPSRTAVGNAFLEVQSLVEPGRRLVLEARQENGRDEDESGEPPEPSGAPAVTGTGEGA
ncbi:MAG TPA: hypothetical protein PKJ99_05610 [Thermoanaerobaculales bacterium]|nr:hypothetical protein [Thermoanaerobaculales bacterium]HPA82275.1 hypothetical protein [Thermoanaerobaculales bacterium]HQL28897.1 hypothetical protein [Thermoanaerobaculales bacterium]HQN96388.1 hypothetical protein [Thermoanaerobaculales bacterium]HQP44254.1 hypothetical protein [Thermoanaerobaculales bacterium]